MRAKPVTKYVCDKLGLKEEMWVVECVSSQIRLKAKDGPYHLIADCTKSLRSTVETFRLLFKEVYGIEL